MRLMRSMTILAIALAVLYVDATAGNTPERLRGEAEVGRRGAPPPQARGGRGRGRGRGRRPAVVSMTVALSAWTDGGHIPLRYTQVGPEISPGVGWSNVPPGTESFVLIMRDLDATNRDGTTALMHWLLWNIPGGSTNIPQNLPELFELDNGTRQISASGPRYRGPGAMAGGSVHHYVLEVYALDTMLDVEVVPRVPRQSSPADNARAAVFGGMEGHVLGKGSYVGLFRRPQ